MNNKTLEFIKKAKQIHGDLYDYNKTKYRHSNKKIAIICKQHNIFYQLPSSHLSGCGCPHCGRIQTNNSRRLSIEKFIEKAKQIHGDLYDYSKITEYNNDKIKVPILCRTHGVFYQRPNDHLLKHGCPHCGRVKASKNRKLTIEKFIEKAKQIHGDLYDYSKITEYNNDKIKVPILCRTHGVFYQTPNNHLFKRGCPKCKNKISNMETEWLNKMEDSNNKIDRQVKIILNNQQTFIVDGFDKKTNTVYEFLGDFWHGNPKIYNPKEINPITKTSYGELYQQTQEKINLLKQNGFNVIFIWENDWIDQKTSEQFL